MQTEISDNSYKVKTGSFEGPFGLLLNLVEERKLFINELSLAQVTEDYLKYVNAMGGADSAEISSFIVVAATLILIKSKSLLPGFGLSAEEEGDIKSLEERLRLYELFSKISLEVKKNFGKRMIFAPLERKIETLVFLPDERITRESMMEFARAAVDRIPKKPVLSEVEVKKVISIEEMIDRLSERMQNTIKMNFKDFAGVPARAGRPATREEKVFVIVSFLAMLELTRQGIINAIQENNFEDIVIEKFSSIETENI